MLGRAGGGVPVICRDRHWGLLPPSPGAPAIRLSMLSELLLRGSPAREQLEPRAHLPGGATRRVTWTGERTPCKPGAATQDTPSAARHWVQAHVTERAPCADHETWWRQPGQHMSRPSSHVKDLPDLAPCALLGLPLGPGDLWQLGGTEPCRRSGVEDQCRCRPPLALAAQRPSPGCSRACGGGPPSRGALLPPGNPRRPDQEGDCSGVLRP